MELVKDFETKRKPRLNPKSLYIKYQTEEFVLEDLEFGPYVFIGQIDTKLPGDLADRHIVLQLHVTNRREETVFQETIKLQGNHKTTVVEFFIKKNDTGRFHLNKTTHSLFGQINFKGQLLRNKHIDSHRFYEEMKECLQCKMPFKTLIFDDITRELLRASEHRRKASEQGMIRPFLFLASMHSATRQQIGQVLGMELIGKHFQGDNHAESWHILNKNRIGLQAATR